MNPGKLYLTAAALTFALTATALAGDERVEHFEGEPAETLEQAISNFSEYNAKLAQIMEQDELSLEDFGQIHELTYTLENALGKISEELEELAETLERLHLASEHIDHETVRQSGSAYLATAREIIE
ncbi:MAG: hypothetical protein HND55_09360 [Pseudomonadota bacterium]|nr:MAG: hypothetical protein HND55_09360 [Pseudomonadota bacterium]